MSGRDGASAEVECRSCATRNRARELGLPPNGPFTPAEWLKLWPAVETDTDRYRPADEPEARQAHLEVQAAQAVLDEATARWEAAVVALADHDRSGASETARWAPWRLGKADSTSGARARLSRALDDAQRARDEAGQAWGEANARHHAVVRRLHHQALTSDHPGTR